MIRHLSVPLLPLFLGVTMVAAGQQEAAPPEEPASNPGRPTVSTPATLTPVAYLQFESGFLGAWPSSEFSSQSSLNEVVKFAVSRRIELLAGAGPFAHSRAGNQAANGAGDVFLGVQGVVHQGEGVQPTIALSYFRRVYVGDTPDLDIGSARNSMLLLFSADVKGFHYDNNYFFNEVVDSAIHRAQFGQTLSVSHPLGGKSALSGPLYHSPHPPLR